MFDRSYPIIALAVGEISNAVHCPHTKLFIIAAVETSRPSCPCATRRPNMCLTQAHSSHDQ